jgi:hypothetical protein
MFNERSWHFALRAALMSACLAVLTTPFAGAQSTADEGAESASPPPASPLPAPTSQASEAPPRPRMGLMVPLTPPRGQPVPKAAKTGSKGAIARSPYRNSKATEKAQHYYIEVWGVDKLQANYTSSGNLIKFSYRVLQPKLAKTLGDHENTPELVGIRSNAVLHIPTMEKIGQLRQMSAAEANKQYWMVFSNKGNLVKPGDEVSVIIGKFRADGLIVE